MASAKHVQRIIVALDTSLSSFNTLKAATELAAAFNAEILGLFIEDSDLFQLAKITCVEEIVYASGEARAFDESRLEKNLKSQAARLKKELVTLAKQFNVPCRFQVTRARIFDAILAAGNKDDILMFGQITRPWMQGATLSSIAIDFAAQTDQTIIFLERDLVLTQPLLTIFDGSDTAVKALITAAELAQEDGVLVVVIPSDDLKRYDELQQQADELLKRLPKKIVLRYLTISEDILILVHTVRQQRVGIVIFPGNHSFIQGKELLHLLKQMRCPVILVR